jgi:hypothetical protein
VSTTAPHAVSAASGTAAASANESVDGMRVRLIELTEMSSA